MQQPLPRVIPVDDASFSLPEVSSFATGGA